MRAKQNEDESYILIFDSVNELSYNETKDYIPKEPNEQLQVVITSREKDFFPDGERNFCVGSFTDEEAVEFLLQESNIQQEEALKIAHTFFNLPLGLQKARLVLKINENISIDEYLALLKN